MRIVLGCLAAIVSLAFGAFAYQQLYVEGELGPASMVGIALLGITALGLAVLAYLAGTRRRELVSNVLLAAGVTVVSYLAIDVLAGWLLIVPLSPPLVPDAYRHHALVPNSYAELRQRDFAYIQRVNKLGFRGRETTVEKPPKTRRVIMLGDSFTMGKGVQDNETFSVLAERSLNVSAAACSGGTVEVINGGVDSYAPVLSYIQLKRDLALLEPDLVVLNFDNSDLIQEAAYRQQATRDAKGEIVAVPQLAQDSLYERFVSWTSRHLFLTRVALVYINRAMDHRQISVRRVVNEAGREHFAHTLEGDVDRSAQWREVFDSIGRIKALTDSIHSKFLLTTYPWAHQLGDKDWMLGRAPYMKPGEKVTDLSGRTMRERSTALGIDFFETLPAFQSYKGSEKLYFDYDPHWTPLGQKLMADALAGYIAEHYLPQWCGQSPTGHSPRP